MLRLKGSASSSSSVKGRVVTAVEAITEQQDPHASST